MLSARWSELFHTEFLDSLDFSRDFFFKETLNNSP